MLKRTPHAPADRHHLVRVEPRVSAHGQLATGPGLPHSPDRLAQEVGGTSHRVGVSLAQARHEHVAGPGGNGKQRMVSAHPGVAVVTGALLLQPVGLADRGVEIDGQGLGAGARARRPGAGEQFAAHRVELADMAPAEAAQEGAEGGRRLGGEPQDPSRAARPERVRVVDRVATRQGREDEGEELVADVRSSGCSPQNEVTLRQRLQAEVVGQRGRQQQPRVGHQVVVVEGRVEAVKPVR
jgi:hypothetical protein